MEKSINLFILGVVLLGSAVLRILENLIHRTIPLWTLLVIGFIFCLYGIALYREDHPPEKKNG